MDVPELARVSAAGKHSSVNCRGHWKFDVAFPTQAGSSILTVLEGYL